MISEANQLLLANAMQAVAQHRAQASAQAAQAAQQQAVAKIGAKPAAGAKKTAAKPKASTPKPKAAAKSSITPYLTADDIMGAQATTAAAENADTENRFGLATAAANAMKNSGDIERSRVAGVAGANNDAADRGILHSGIQQGNVGTANSNAARAQEQNTGTYALAAAKSVADRNNQRQQFAGYLQTLSQKSAENGMALPVAPDKGPNVPGAKTVRKTTTKPKVKR